MEGDIDGEYSPFPGSFAETIYNGQGGEMFGASIPGGLPTHPNTARQASATAVKLKARYKQFDLSRPEQVLELEEIMTDIMNGGKVLRQERMANDKDGMTVVTLSWAEYEVKEKPVPEVQRDEDGKPYKLQTQFPFPTVDDGEYPGAGVTLAPPGYSVQQGEEESLWTEKARAAEAQEQKEFEDLQDF